MPVFLLAHFFPQYFQGPGYAGRHRAPGDVKDHGDFFFLQRDTVSAAASTLVELYANRLPKAYGYDPINDIQIICPSRKGEAGTVSLNNALQSILNPPADGKDEVQTAGRVFRVGDKVMQTKNNYDILWTRDGRTGEGVFNGDIGVIEAVNPTANLCKVRFDDKTALYPFEHIRELEHAYAVTVHKSQGCEFEAVLMPAVGVVPQLCYRNLLYTAVTRAKTRMIVIGSRATVEAMVDNDKKTRRYSALCHFLTKDDGGPALDKSEPER